MSQPDSLKRNLTIFFIGIVLLGLALLWWLVAGLMMRDFRIATKYQEAQCRILDFKVERFESRTKEGVGRGRRTVSERPVFTYRFTVEGKEFVSSGYDSVGGRDAKSAEYSRFRAGETYPCWYDPADPKQAVLVKEWKPRRYWAAAGPLVFIFMALVFLRGITGGPKVSPFSSPAAPRPAAPSLPGNQSPSRAPRNMPWKFILAGVGGAGFITLAVVVPIVAQQKERAAYPEVGAARSDGPALLERLGLPPDTEATGFRTFNDPAAGGSKRSRNAWDAGAAKLSWTHPHATKRDFASTVVWYAEKLSAEGWKTHRTADADGAEFCQPLWRLQLTRTERGYDLRLEWNNRFNPEECAHP